MLRPLLSLRSTKPRRSHIESNAIRFSAGCFARSVVTRLVGWWLVVVRGLSATQLRTGLGGIARPRASVFRSVLSEPQEEAEEEAGELLQLDAQLADRGVSVSWPK